MKFRILFNLILVPGTAVESESASVENIVHQHHTIAVAVAVAVAAAVVVVVVVVVVAAAAAAAVAVVVVVAAAHRSALVFVTMFFCFSVFDEFVEVKVFKEATVYDTSM